MILILGPEDMHTRRVKHAIEAYDGQAVFWDTGTFPTGMGINYALGHQRDNCQTDNATVFINQQLVHLSQIKAVYWYSYGCQGANAAHYQAVLGTLAYGYQGSWINSPQAFMGHQFKVHQLHQAAQWGAKIPPTLLTNQASMLVDFWHNCQQQVIIKDLVNSTVPRRLTTADLTPDALLPLAHYPVFAQQWIEGVDIRVHVVGEQLFASAITSDTDCYKTDQAMRIQRHTLPDDVAHLTLQLAKGFDLKLAGIDYRLTPRGEYVFFEANPSPQYLIFEDQCQYAISECLARLLLSF
jgi:glutathione synthase/RimK-type ligase-like ATP-grasp enzyme